MAMLNRHREYAGEFERRLRLKTFPLAVKMLKDEEDTPEGATKPKRDLGYHLATCQGFAISRREGILITMLKEDMWCSESFIGFGLAEPPHYFLDGHTRYPDDNATLEAGSVWAHELPKFQPGEYVGVVSGPLAAASFEPDVVIFYTDSTQLKVLLSAAAWKEGHELTCTVASKGACVYAVVPVMQHQRYQVTVPCGGDKRFAMSQDDEMIFAAPYGKIEELLTALRHLDEYGLRLPLGHAMMPEYQLRQSYLKVGKMMGMDIDEGKRATLRARGLL
jgi:uncharacterized protein (DUF169 family)